MPSKIKFALIIIIIIIAVLLRMIKTNGYEMTGYINKFLNKMTDDPSTFDPRDFDWTLQFRNNYKEILKEYQDYMVTHTIPAHNKINSHVASCDLDSKWKTLYLRAFKRDTDMMEYFPLTEKLINKCPCSLAFFSLLEPNAKLTEHIGVYKGVIRYHLGLIVPDDSDNCFIVVDGHKLHWTPGSDIMFDDLYPHYVENNTNQSRLVLFLDIERDFHNVFVNAFNKLILYSIKSNDALNDTINNANKLSITECASK
jgi:aspartyl/asparaginyl beta-hydroxylase (cupin superfamily)